MKIESVKTDLFILVLLLVVCAMVWMMAEHTIVDIQLHDSYFVLDKGFLIGLIIGPLGFLIFLARAIRRRFKNLSTNICLAMELVVVALITYFIIQVQQDYTRELQALEDIDVSTRQRVIDNARGGILWSWIVFGVWCVGFVLIVFHTVRIWRASSNR